MGERPLSVESQEDGLPALAGGVITGWEDTYTKIKNVCFEWGFTFKDIQCTVALSILKQTVRLPDISIINLKCYLAGCYLCKVGVETEIATLFHPSLHYPHPHCQYQRPGSSLHDWTCTSEMEGLGRGRREQKGGRGRERGQKEEAIQIQDIAKQHVYMWSWAQKIFQVTKCVRHW